ncbi:MAG TPA: hypothetical protein VL405_07555 [Sphingomonas sp.]|nr:hypothetical protein [Sphingomonas sp.]
MNWPLAAGSIVAVFAVAGICRWLGLGGAEFTDERAAMDEAEAQVGGFIAASARIIDGGAEVTGTDGRIVHIRRLGARWVIAA